jgi:two-component system repressor protein LuxO
VVLHNDRLIIVAHLPAPLNRLSSAAKTSIRPVADNAVNVVNTLDNRVRTIIALGDVEPETIETALNVCASNIPKAAALLDVSPSTIYRKKTGLGIKGNHKNNAQRALFFFDQQLTEANFAK